MNTVTETESKALLREDVTAFLTHTGLCLKTHSGSELGLVEVRPVKGSSVLRHHLSLSLSLPWLGSSHNISSLPLSPSLSTHTFSFCLPPPPPSPADHALPAWTRRGSASYYCCTLPAASLHQLLLLLPGYRNSCPSYFQTWPRLATVKTGAARIFYAAYTWGRPSRRCRVLLRPWENLSSGLLSMFNRLITLITMCKTLSGWSLRLHTFILQRTRTSERGCLRFTSRQIPNEHRLNNRVNL